MIYLTLVYEWTNHGERRGADFAISPFNLIYDCDIQTQRQHVVNHKQAGLLVLRAQSSIMAHNEVGIFELGVFSEGGRPA